MTALRPVGVRRDRRSSASLVAGTMWLIRRWHQQQLRAPPRRGRAPAGDRPPRQALSGPTPRARTGAPGRAGAGLQRLRLGHLVVAAAPAAGAGLHPLWATAIDLHARLAGDRRSLRPRACGQVLRDAGAVAAGRRRRPHQRRVQLGASSIGDVVRVVLLFYLMPLWTVLLARAAARRAPDARGGAARRRSALVGAAIVLWPARATGASGWPRLPLPRSLADWLGVLGGFSFAFNNVMLRREADRPEEGAVAGDVRRRRASSPARWRRPSPRAAASRRRRPSPARPGWLLTARARRSSSSPATSRCNTARRACRRTGPRSSC